MVDITTTVPQPIFGDSGIVLPTEPAILQGVQTDINNALGGNVNPALSTPQGQISTTETAIIGDAYALFAWYINQVDPAFNSGRMQDGIGRIYFMSRISASSTVVQARCTGLDGVVIPVGAIAQAQDGNLYISQQRGIISGGSVTLEFACAKTGPILAPADSFNWSIYQAIFGWDGLTTAADGAVGRNVETRAQFEERRNASVALNARQILDAIQANVLAVHNVLDAYCTENDTEYTLVQGGQILGPHSLYVCALGGTDTDIGNAIWLKKGPGCGYNGDTSVVVTDSSGDYNPPVPAYTVRFQRPTLTSYEVLVTIKNNPNIPPDALNHIQNAVLAAWAGTDDGPRARIGSTLFASRYYAGVASIASWVQIVKIELGRKANAASIIGHIDNSTLTVSSVIAGTIEVGALLSGTSTNLETGTTIIAELGGTGGAGTYQVSKIQTVPSTIFGLTTLYNDLQVDINVAPTLSAGDINMALEP